MAYVYQRYIEGTCTIDQLVHDWGIPITKLAKDLELSVATLKKWDTHCLLKWYQDGEITDLLKECFDDMIEDGLA